MTQDNNDVFARAYARLSALRKIIGDMVDYLVLETYVQEFHAVLDKLKAIGIDVAEFRVPNSLVQPRIESSWYDGSGSHQSYSEEKYIDKSFILTKLDAILGYFEITMSEKPRKIGFSPPDNR